MSNWLFKEKVLCNEKNACSIHANVFFQKTYDGNKIYFWKGQLHILFLSPLLQELFPPVLGNA